MKHWIMPGIAAAALQAAAEAPAPAGLSVNLLRWPEAAVITTSAPRFSWEVPQAAVRQTAYRIRVADEPEALRGGAAVLWDSGRMASDRNILVPYAGAPLAEHRACWWQVQVWDAEGRAGPWSAPQRFNTGSFDRSDLAYPGESRWVELAQDEWVSEDRQSASFVRQKPIAVDRTHGALFVEFERGAIGVLEFDAVCAATNRVTVHLGERRDGDAVHKEPGVSNIGYRKVEMELLPGFHHYRVNVPRRKIHGYLHSQQLAPHLPEVMPFRYAEVEAAAPDTRFSAFRQAALLYPFDETAGGFSSSDANLNAVWNLCRYTQKATPFLGVYADGNRERMPYEADAYIQMLSHFATDREYAIARYTIRFLLDHASWPTEWQLHMPLMAWAYYEYTGDEELLRDCYEKLKVKTLIELTEMTGLISTRTGLVSQDLLDRLGFPGKPPGIKDIVDWPPGRPDNPESTAAFLGPLPGGERDGFVFTDYNCVVNAFHNRSLQCMAKIAAVLGQEEDARFFRKRAEKHRVRFIETFLNPETGLFVDGMGIQHSSLHANMFAMAFGLVPEAHRTVVQDFVESRGMACSVYGAQYLLEALYEAGSPGPALELMRSDGKRSWINMIRAGASMTTEAWDEYYKPNLTWNHAWGSAPANIIVRRLAGIEPIEPAFRRFRVRPQPGTLHSFSLRAPTLQGPVGVTCSNVDGQWHLTIDVPGNTECELWLPGRFNAVAINGAEVKPARREQEGQVYLLPPGRHEIAAGRAAE